MRILKKNIIVLLVFSLFTEISFASKAVKTSPFPRGCEVTGFGFSENYLILNEKGDQTLFLIQNRSNAVIELERHETQEVFMSPSLQSKLSPSAWAAFASDIGGLYFKCFIHENDNTALVNCSDVLDVCEYPRVKFALSNMGNYWVSTNKTQNQVINDAVAKGILLRW